MVSQYWAAADSARETRRWTLRKGLKVSIGILAALLVLQAAFELLLAPHLRISQILLEGDLLLSDEELFEYTGLKKSDSFYNLQVKTLEERLLLQPRVREARVEKVFPDRVRFMILGRKPLALVLALLDGVTVPVALDREGVIFQVGGDVLQLDLPIISGIEVESVAVGLALPKILIPVFEQLYELKKSSPGLYAMISEIEIKKTSEYSFDLVLYPAQIPVRVRLGQDISETVLKQVAVVLDLIRKDRMYTKLNEIDFRTDKVVLTAGGS